MKYASGRIGIAGSSRRYIEDMDRPLGIAGRIGLERLYHYQPLDGDLDSDRLIDILRNRRVYCSNPANFNDPWDCRPFFDLDVTDDPVKRLEIAEQFIANQKSGPKGDPIDDQLRADPAFLKQCLRGLTNEFCKTVPERWGVYCVGKSADTALMWSHYASNHTGICLEFAVKNSPFIHAWEVRYQEEYPVFRIDDVKDHINILITKSNVWRYEEEFRLVCPRSTDVPGHPLAMQGDYLPIGNDSLKSIIVGCQASHRTVTALRVFIQEHAPDVVLRRTVRSLNKYRLMIVDF
jgi:hypothetical protein